MRIGYACLTIGVDVTNFKSCILKNANRDNLLTIIEHNLKSLENQIDYNIKNNIRLFRITSDLIPFGSSPVNDIPWWKVFSEDLEKIGKKIEESGMRVSMHPGQYSVLNSPREEVVKMAIGDLIYHNRVLDSLGVGRENKIILHIGGVYEDRERAIERFCNNYKKLDEKIKRRLVIENDDKCFNIEEVLRIGLKLNIPVVYDNLHSEILIANSTKDHNYWINKCKLTWMKEDGTQKIHYSQQDKGKRPGAHSPTIGVEKFIDFTKGLDGDIDIMLEVKDKNLSAVKCINLNPLKKNIKILEREWSKYKYNVLEQSPIKYNEIRQLLKNKEDYPVVEFYKLIEESFDLEPTLGNTINALQHVWGYFKTLATDSEKKKFSKLLIDLQEGKTSKKTLKNFLYRLSIKYEIEYLMDSYFFHL